MASRRMFSVCLFAFPSFSQAGATKDVRRLPLCIHRFALLPKALSVPQFIMSLEMIYMSEKDEKSNEGIHWIRGDEIELVEDSHGETHWVSVRRIF